MEKVKVQHFQVVELHFPWIGADACGPREAVFAIRTFGGEQKGF